MFFNIINTLKVPTFISYMRNTYIKRKDTSKGLHKRATVSNLRNLIGQNFTKESQHDWIVSSVQLSKVFNELFNILDHDALNMIAHRRIIFARSNNKYSCVISTPNDAEVILIFPDLEKMLNSASFFTGIAVLIHELGHVVNNHSQKNISPITAQLEADDFVKRHNLSKELISTLDDHKYLDECKLRIKLLNINNL